MAKLPHHPPTPDEIRASFPTFTTIPAGALLWRVYARGGPYGAPWNRFRSWGPTRSRFDHHLPGPDGKGCDQARAILYVASDFTTCLAEYFQARRMIDRTRDHTTVVAFALARPLRLLNLWDAWSTRVGASGALSTGRHDVARVWSRSFYDAIPDADGLYYESSMHPGKEAMAIWERGADSLPAVPQFHRALADPDVWTPIYNAARRLGYKLV